MRGARGVALMLLLLPLGGLLAGCDSFDTFSLFDTKKKLPGVREPVFPNGVPGVTQGIPPELMKGYQEQSSPDPAAAAAAATAEKIEPPKPAPKPKPKPKPKPRTAAAPQPAAQPPQQAQPPYQQPAPQPAAQPGQAPWPSQPAQQGAGWPQPR
jgi:outer membrane biosynthesis protein TonB